MQAGCVERREDVSTGGVVVGLPVARRSARADLARIDG